MVPVLSKSRRASLALPAVVAIALWPVMADAAVLGFRNETEIPVLVQGISMINRVARRGKLHVLRPGEVSQEPILVPGTILIIIADAKQPTRILSQETLQFTGTDLFYAIQPDLPNRAREAEQRAPKAKVQSTVLPKVKLVPSKLMPPQSLPPSKQRR